MKRKLFSIYDVFFLVVAAAVFIWAVFVPPVHSIADQGDFERIMRPCGIDFPSDHSFYDWANRFFPMKFTTVDLLLYIPRLFLIVPSTAFILPTAITRLICMPFGTFDMRVLAAIMFIWYTTVCFFILRRVEIKNPILHFLFLVFFIVVFYNGVNLTFFNSLYGQSVMLTSFATLILASIYLFDNITTTRKRTIIFFTIASCLMLGSKLQCIVFLPFLLAAIIYVGFKSNKRKFAIICALFVMWHGVGGYIINGGQLNLATQYNSVFYGILKDSPNPAKDLQEMGIDEDMAVDSGNHAFLDQSEYKYPPNTEIMQEKFYSKMSNTKIIKFYITHPSRFMNAMESTAKVAFSNKVTLGTFEEKYGFDKGTSSYRFELWETIRSYAPHTLLFIIPIWLIFLTVAIILAKKKNKYALPLIAVFVIGAIQFPMPYIGNGAADISKQLFLFNIIFDLGITMLLYILLQKMKKSY